MNLGCLMFLVGLVRTEGFFLGGGRYRDLLVFAYLLHKFTEYIFTSAAYLEVFLMSSLQLTYEVWDRQQQALLEAVHSCTMLVSLEWGSMRLGIHLEYC